MGSESVQARRQQPVGERGSWNRFPLEPFSLENSYLEEDWPACARRLGKLAEPLASLAAAARVDLGMAGDYLRWLASHADPPTDDAGFEPCVLGFFALGRLVRQIQRSAGL